MRYSAVAFLLPVLLAACDGGGTRTDDILALTGDAAAGATTYSGTCAACHGADGQGGVGAVLTDAVPGLEDADLVDTIILGSGDMAPVSLTDQEVANVVAHLRASFP